MAGLPFATPIPVSLGSVRIEDMDPAAVRALQAAVAAAARAGVARIQVIAGKAETGHVSHYAGTEWDIVGYQANGERWTQDQRGAVAGGARQGGANRFGFYSGPGGRYQGNSLHMGTGPGGRNQNVTWGFGGATSGEGSRAFTHSGEAQFTASL